MQVVALSICLAQFYLAILQQSKGFDVVHVDFLAQGLYREHDVREIQQYVDA